MGGCQSDLQHKGDANSLEECKIATESNLSLAEGKEPPSFQELCARQQDLDARSDALKNAVAHQTQKRSFRSELADIVLKGPRRPVKPPEEESEVVEDDGLPGHSTHRVKLSYRRPTLKGTTTPEMKVVVDKYFDTLEELKRFVVSGEIYLDRKAPSTEGKAGDDEQDLGRADTVATEENEPTAKENSLVEPISAVEKGAVVEQADSSELSADVQIPRTSVETTEDSAKNLKEVSESLLTTPEKRKKKKTLKAKKRKRAFSCFSSENCE